MTTQGRADAPVLVVVTGPPASGKSTIAAELARRARLPLLAKDEIKEILFDTFGWADRAWSRRLGIATYPLLFAAADAVLRAGRSLVLEANFDHRFDRAALCRLPPSRLLQVVCDADPGLLIRRIQERARSGARHPPTAGSMRNSRAGSGRGTGSISPRSTRTRRVSIW